MVEGARLERVYTRNRIVGSNPSLTASKIFDTILPDVVGQKYQSKSFTAILVHKVAGKI